MSARYDGDPQDLEPTAADLGGAPCEACGGVGVCSPTCPALEAEPEGVDVEDEIRACLIADALYRRGEMTLAEYIESKNALVMAAVERSGIVVTPAEVDEALAAKVEADHERESAEDADHFPIRRNGSIRRRYL